MMFWFPIPPLSFGSYASSLQRRNRKSGDMPLKKDRTTTMLSISDSLTCSRQLFRDSFFAGIGFKSSFFHISTMFLLFWS